MRDVHARLLDVVNSFLVNRHDLAASTMRNYRVAIEGFANWVESSLGRPAEIADIEPGTVETFLAYKKTAVSAQSARSAWVALRSLATFLKERHLVADGHDSALRAVRMPRVKDEARRALSDREMFTVIERAEQGEQGPRDAAIVWTFLGCGLRREELAQLRLGDITFSERRLHIRAATSKSVHSRDVTVPIETLKALDNYVNDYRKGGDQPDDPLFTDVHGGPLTGNAIRKLFERLKVRSGIRDLSAHLLRHTWATNFHRSGSGSRFDLMVEGGWTTGRMVERYTKARPFEERRRAPSPFTAARNALKEKRPAEMRSSQKERGLYANRVA